MGILGDPAPGILENDIFVVPTKFCIIIVFNFSLGSCEDLEYICRFCTQLTTNFIVTRMKNRCTNAAVAEIQNIAPGLSSYLYVYSVKKRMTR